MVLDEHSDLDVLWHDGMITFEIGTLSYMEVRAAVVACLALLSVAAEALDSDQQKCKKSQQV